MKPEIIKIKKRVKKSLSAYLASPFPPISINRFRVVKILLRQKHPLIAARVILPGLFIGLVGGLGMVYISLQQPHQAAAAGITSANLWVDTNGGSCTRSATLVVYNDANACGSMQTAMTAAQGGDTVIIKNGTYASQNISSGTKSSVVSFYAETYDQAVTAADAYSATTGVYVSSLSLSGVDKIHIYGVQATPTPDNSRTDARLTYAGGGDLGICSSGCSSITTTDILVDGFHGRSFFGRVTNVVIDHASFGGWDACYNTSGQHLASGNSGTEDGFRFWEGTGGSGTPTNSVVRNSVFHDIIMGVNDSEENNVCTYGSSLGPHADCMQNNGGAGITVENNIFFNCPSSDIQWNPFNTATVGTQIIQNNYFGSIGGTGNGTVLGAQGSGYNCSGIIVRNNYYNNNQGINYSSGCTVGGPAQFYGNIFKSGGFSTQGANYHDNVFVSNPLGANARSCTPSFVSAPAPGPDWLAVTTPNFHLANADTCAKDHGYSTFPAADFEGDARPQGALSDAGPDEVSGGGNGDSTPPTVSISAPTNGATVTGTTTVSANAADNVGVVGVQFKLDGNDLGSEDTSSPYSISWDSTTAVNGAHSLTAVARDSNGNTTASAAVNVTASNTLSCTQSSASWQNSSLTSQTGTFTLDFDATPNGAAIDAVSGLSSGAATDFTSLAVIARFNTSGLIDAINGSGYSSAASVPYSSGTTYHFTLSVNITAHTYTIKVTPSGGSQVVLGTNYAFRTDQAAVSSLSNWAVFSDVGTQKTCNVELSAGTSDTTAPSIPTGLTKSSASTSSISMSWNASADNSGGSGLAGYDIYRNGTFLTEVINLTSYTDTGLNPGTSYSYQVSAIDNSSNQSSKSASVAMSTSSSSGSSPPSSSVKGDCNTDGHVNLTDLSILLSHYGASYSKADFDSSGSVSLTDLSILLSNYGK